MIYTVSINNKEYIVEVERGKANILKTNEITRQNNPAPAQVSAPAAPVAAPAPAPAAAPASASAQPAAAPGAEIVKAPMPGTILNVKVSQGSKVKKGDILLILEAMKMENEIVAPSDGTVAQLFVSNGSSVSTGDNLITIQ